MATVLMPGPSHLSNFNKPQLSRHKIIFPEKPGIFHYLASDRDSFSHILLGVATWKPLKYQFDIVHSFNEVPITNKPWIGTFECEIPRTIGKNQKIRRNLVRRLLLRDNCKRIIALSKFAAERTKHWNQGWPLLPDMLRKIEVIHPTVYLKTQAPKKLLQNPIKVVFCGRMFAQKGGIVALRLAKLAYQSNFPLETHIISSLDAGWTDVSDRKRYAADIELLDLPNVKFHKELPNDQVLRLFSSCDFTFLPTLHDTYGYSVLEGFSVGTPAIVTATCALPEIVYHGENGYLLDVDVDDLNEITWLGTKSNIWERIYQGLLSTDEYWEQQNATFDDLASQTFKYLNQVYENKYQYEEMSQSAIEHIKNFHSVEKTSNYFDQLYEDISVNS
jgi:glycosyltransferase involved in cell wall biosynthesis